MVNKYFNATHGETVRTVVRIQGIHVGSVEVQVTGICSTWCGRPVISVAANIVQSAAGTVAVARSRSVSNLLIESVEGRKTNYHTDYLLLPSETQN